jgi:5-dehydro-2-deoxygluconokinase
MDLGFDQPLYVLPFDHRGTFQTKMFGWEGALTVEQTAEISALEQVICDGFRAALAGGVHARKAGILVDEQFGAAILRDAAARGYTTALTTEKSGRDEFDFEYGDDFAAHIEAFRPTFCKVLVRYNPVDLLVRYVTRKLGGGVADDTGLPAGPGYTGLLAARS